MVPFAGYDMPVQYPTGIIVEHKQTRTSAGLFDVSHMGQVKLHGENRIAALEALVPGDLEGLDIGAMRYSLFTNDKGGVLDDLMITRCEDHLFLVVNAGCKDADIAHLKKHPEEVSLGTLLGGPSLNGMESDMKRGTEGIEAVELIEASLKDNRPCSFVMKSGYEQALKNGDVHLYDPLPRFHIASPAKQGTVLILPIISSNH